MRARLRLLLAAAGLAALFVCPGGAAQEAPSWRITRGEVRVVCPLTVGGSFEAKSLALEGTLALQSARPAPFAGELTLDLRTLDTGIGLRNDHLRDTYLEVGKGEGFAAATLSEIRLGDVDAASVEGRTGFTAMLLLHGARKAISGQAEIRRDASSIRVEASFLLSLQDFAIEKPRYLGVGVKDEVRVKVSLAALPTRTPGAGVR